jgi:predicted RNA-binding Zn ribbon-like protein
VGRFSTRGGRLCLDFCNTVGDHGGATPSEHLRAYGDLVAWGRQLGVLDGAAAAGLLARAAAGGAAAGAALGQAHALREALFRVFVAALEGGSPARADLGALQRALGEAWRHRRLAPGAAPGGAGGQRGAPGYAWTWEGMGERLDGPLWPVVQSAAELLTSPDLARLRRCAAAPCGWLFLDRSRNRSRRWCAMEACGNQAKTRRHLERRRAARREG